MDIINHLLYKMKTQVEVIDQSIGHIALSRLLKQNSSNVFIGAIPVLELFLILQKYDLLTIESAGTKIEASSLASLKQADSDMEAIYNEAVSFREHTIRLHTLKH